MSSPYSTTPANLCKHPGYRVACWSCCANDTSRELAEAVVQTKKREHDMQLYKTFLAQSDMSHDERERFQAKLAKATEQHVAWNKRSQGLSEMVTYVEEQVKAICDAMEGSALADAFEAVAIEREEEFEEVWRNAARTQEAEKFVQFQPEDPRRDVPFKGLDRSSIPATADSLVSDGIGLQVFIRHGKALNHQQPAYALGEQPGPATMSYGSALAMFGTPEAPGDDMRRENEPSAERSVKESMKECAITADEPEPSTEHDYRLQYGGQPLTEPILSTDEQWALFKSGKFMADTALLARQYAKLVAERKEASNKENGKSPGEKPAADSTVPKSSTDGEGWPPVEELDWAGFTNWVYRCKNADKKFGSKTIKSWKTQRRERGEAITDLLREWKPPQDFNDGSSTDPDPKQFFPRDVSLAELDMKKMGIQRSTSAVKKNPPPVRR